MIRNKYLIKLYVKAHYMWYYIKHPITWWKIRKMRDSNMRELMNLYIGRLNMIDKEHDSIDWMKFTLWCGLIAGLGIFWYSIFTNGFFVTLMYLIIVSATIGLWLRLSGRA